MTSSDLHERVKVKVFIGCLLTSDLHFLLKKSAAWQGWLIEQKNENPSILQEIRYKNQNYLGSYVVCNNITIPLIDSLSNFIKEKLTTHFSELDTDQLKFYIFPQVFIS